ncbi:hypothetical protein Lal_00042928 [Lupinus albus]|nr:hypothetical protein Lal_00042928 [Lupinus albus]
MASSSKRPRSSKYKQGESTSNSNPLNLTRLLANDAQSKIFEENFHGRAIFTPKYANDIYPELARVFYCNMNFRKNLMTSHVKGKDIVLDMKTFSPICCDIPMTGDITGFDMVCEWDDYDRKKFYLSICRISKEKIKRRKQQSLGETVKNRDILSAAYLTLEDRLIHYFLTYVILPKFSNHSQISDIELQLMYAIKFNIKINWTKMIMQQMWHVGGSQSLLPYVVFITKILKHFGVSLDGETKVALNLRESKYQPSDPRLSERFSLERERFNWEGEILGYTKGFSPELELSRLGEKWHFGAVATVRFSLEREGQI